jgi:hypothetical protein
MIKCEIEAWARFQQVVNGECAKSLEEYKIKWMQRESPCYLLVEEYADGRHDYANGCMET